MKGVPATASQAVSNVEYTLYWCSMATTTTKWSFSDTYFQNRKDMPYLSVDTTFANQEVEVAKPCATKVGRSAGLVMTKFPRNARTTRGLSHSKFLVVNEDPVVALEDEARKASCPPSPAGTHLPVKVGTTAFRSIRRGSDGIGAIGTDYDRCDLSDSEREVLRARHGVVLAPIAQDECAMFGDVPAVIPARPSECFGFRPNGKETQLVPAFVRFAPRDVPLKWVRASRIAVDSSDRS